MEESFLPKYDWWMVIAILGILGMAAFLGYFFMVKANLTYEGFLPIVILVFVIVFMFFTRYTVASREIVIRFGPFRFRYPYSSIVRVVRSGPFQGSGVPVSVNFCFSSDYLVVFLKTGTFRAVTISPRDPERFLRLLSTRGVKVEAQRSGLGLLTVDPYRLDKSPKGMIK
jgi:hypothetical protein